MIFSGAESSLEESLDDESSEELLDDELSVA